MGKNLYYKRGGAWGVYLASSPAHIPQNAGPAIPVADPAQPLNQRYIRPIRLVGYSHTTGWSLVQFTDGHGFSMRDVGVSSENGVTHFIDPIFAVETVKFVVPTVSRYFIWAIIPYELSFDLSLWSLCMNGWTPQTQNITLEQVSVNRVPSKDYPHKCLMCGNAAYIGLFKTDCSSPSCKNHQKS